MLIICRHAPNGVSCWPWLLGQTVFQIRTLNIRVQPVQVFPGFKFFLQSRPYHVLGFLEGLSIFQLLENHSLKIIYIIFHRQEHRLAARRAMARNINFRIQITQFVQGRNPLLYLSVAHIRNFAVENQVAGNEGFQLFNIDEQIPIRVPARVDQP